MKIISYNVNGIRAAMTKGLVDWLKAENPDIICFQELKALADQFDTALFENLGYHCYWNSAEKKGYSGVAVLSKVKPQSISLGFGHQQYDVEGRVIRAEFKDFTLINSYFPSGSSGDERQDFKMKYLNDIHSYIKQLLKSDKKLIVSGDYNICHKPIDINHPERHNDVSGFLPEERAWFDDFIATGFVDTFREFNNEPNQYSWWSYRGGARPKNLGWRIDYHLVSSALKSNLKGAAILQSVVHSDHCPVVVELGL